MVGWFYINDEVAASVRMLEADEQSSILTIEVAARFVPNRSILRGSTIVEYRHWDQRRLVRCLGAELVGNAMMIEAVDVGPANVVEDDDIVHGLAEDWLAVNGRACCQITQLRTNDESRGHCLFHVGLTDWRDLRIGEDAPLASIGINLPTGQDNDGSITPLLHSARDLPLTLSPPKVEVIRLRERQRLNISPIATDWGEDTTLVVARIEEVAPLRRAIQGEPVNAE